MNDIKFPSDPEPESNCIRTVSPDDFFKVDYSFYPKEHIEKLNDLFAKSGRRSIVVRNISLFTEQLDHFVLGLSGCPMIFVDFEVDGKRAATKIMLSPDWMLDYLTPLIDELIAEI